MKFSFLRVSPYDRVFRTKNHLSKLAFFPIFFSKNFGKKTVFFWFEFCAATFRSEKVAAFCVANFQHYFFAPKNLSFFTAKNCVVFLPKKTAVFLQRKKATFFPAKKRSVFSSRKNVPFLRATKRLRFYEPQKGFVFLMQKISFS